MNRILFNYFGLQTCCGSRFHGASEYGKTVLKYLVENYSKQAEILIFYNPIEAIEDWVDELLEKHKIKRIEIYSIKGLKNYVEDLSIDVLYSPTRLDPIIRTIVGKRVMIKETLHDFRAIELTDDISMIKYMSINAAFKNVMKRLFRNIYRNRLIKNARKDIEIMDRMYCVSKHTYYSMRLYFNGLQDKMMDVYYSPAKTIPPIRDIWDKPLNEKYILVIGGDRWIKNPYRSMLAIDMVFSCSQYDEYMAVVIGEKNTSFSKYLNNPRKFLFCEYVETEELERYYANCELFVYASLNEGFGYPPIEAMKYGVTCVVSGTTSIPEICGNAVYYVNPYDVHDMAEKILLALNEKIDKQTIIERSKAIEYKQKNDLEKLCESIVFD